MGSGLEQHTIREIFEKVVNIATQNSWDPQAYLDKHTPDVNTSPYYYSKLDDHWYVDSSSYPLENYMDFLFDILYDSEFIHHLFRNAGEIYKPTSYANILQKSPDKMFTYLESFVLKTEASSKIANNIPSHPNKNSLD